uniref:Putative secreted protein n=1 Tax=Anopheles darlingi TaxID=43151 RepID=A0A2M4DI45_ANODA
MSSVVILPASITPRRRAPTPVVLSACLPSPSCLSTTPRVLRCPSHRKSACERGGDGDFGVLMLKLSIVAAVLSSSSRRSLSGCSSDTSSRISER